MRKFSDSPRRLVRLGAFAKVLGCSERTTRTYCERGLIAEAVAPTKRRGHWRIQLPLSSKTKAWIFSRNNPTPRGHKLGQPIGDFDQELVELLLLAASHELDIESEGDWRHLDRLLDEADARGIEREVEARARTKSSLDNLRLLGWAVQVEVSGKRPTAERLAKALGLSRPALYRRYGKEQVKAAQAAATRFLRREPPETEDPKRPRQRSTAAQPPKTWLPRSSKSAGDSGV